MNETEKDRILRMVAEGTLRPNEAAQLLAALTEESPAPAKSTGVKEKEKEKEKPPMMEVQMQRPDGSNYTIEVPPNLVPMFMKIAGAAIRETARTAAKEAWSGFKNMVRTKTDEVRTTVKTKVSGTKSTASATAVATATPEQVKQSEARQRIIQMVQNGRISPTDAARLLQQIDSLQDFEKANPAGK